MTKQGRNDPCACGSGQKYKKCCLASNESPSAIRPEATVDELRDRRYLLQLDAPAFFGEFVARLRAFLGKDVPAPPELDGVAAPGARYDGVIRVVPMVHRPTEGWAGLPDDVIEFVRESQQELIGCLEDLAAREDIVVVAEGFAGTIDTASFAADANANAALLLEADGYGVMEFIAKNPHVPVVGGDIPPDLNMVQAQLLRHSTRPDVLPVFNALQEYRNRWAVQVALHAARSLNRTPVLVFGLHHAEGIAQAARKVAANVKLTLIPTVAVQSEHLFEPTSPLRQQR